MLYTGPSTASSTAQATLRAGEIVAPFSALVDSTNAAQEERMEQLRVARAAIDGLTAEARLLAEPQKE